VIMQRINIHPEGPVLSRIVSGVWRWHTVSSAAVDQLIGTSLDCGITTFDNADIYGDHSNEEIFGNALKKNPGLRKRMELVTKCGIKFPSAKRPSSWIKHYDTSARHILWSAENSLKLHGTDYLDVLLIHRPDPLLDPQEVADAFTNLKDSGKVLHFGVSNFTPAQFEMVQSYLPFPLVTNQIEISVAKNNLLLDGTLDVLMKHRASPMAWSPLGGGSLMNGQFDTIFSKASNYRASNSQMSLAWLLKHPAKIFPVVGTTKPERIKESAAAMNIDLDLQDWFEMLKKAMGEEMP
jgi:predicted oxidoreductase